MNKKASMLTVSGLLIAMALTIAVTLALIDYSKLGSYNSASPLVIDGMKVEVNPFAVVEQEEILSYKPIQEIIYYLGLFLLVAALLLTAGAG